jgi:hypothetical protein
MESMGRLLRADASDGEILRTLDEWTELIVERRLEDAMALVPVTFDSVGHELEALVGGGQASSPLSDRDVKVATPQTARLAGFVRDIERNDPQPGDKLPYVGTVRYELALEGSWSAGVGAADWDARLTAVFWLQPLECDHSLELAGIYLSALNPTTLRGLIAQQFPRPAPRWLPRLTNYDPTVCSIHVMDDRGLLQKHILVEVRVEGSFLDQHMLPSSSSFGLFAWDRSNLRYLNRGNWHNLELVLAAEAHPLDVVDPYVLAELCAQGPLVVHGGTHKVLRTPEDMKPKQTSVTYKLNEPEFERVSALVHAPRLTGNPQCGWLLRFWTMHGWMHEKKALTCQEVQFSTDFTIQHREQVLSTSIFPVFIGPRY